MLGNLLKKGIVFGIFLVVTSILIIPAVDTLVIREKKIYTCLQEFESDGTTYLPDKWFKNMDISNNNINDPVPLHRIDTVIEKSLGSLTTDTPQLFPSVPRYIFGPIPKIWNGERRVIDRDIVIMPGGKLKIYQSELNVNCGDRYDKTVSITVHPGGELFIGNNQDYNGPDARYVTTNITSEVNHKLNILCRSGGIVTLSKSEIYVEGGLISHGDNLKIENMTMEDFSITSSKDPNVVIKNNTLKNSSLNINDGIATIINNSICDGISGIIIDNCSGIIQKNNITNVYHSFSLPYNSKEMINHLYGNFVNGVNIDGSIYPCETCYYYKNDSLVIDGLMEDCGCSEGYIGALTEQGIITCYDCKGILINNCTLTNNGCGGGIQLDNSSGTVNHSFLENNLFGINCTHTCNIELKYNIMNNNTYGLSVPYNSRESISHMYGNWVNGVNVDGTLVKEDLCYYYKQKNVTISGRIEDCGRAEGYTGSLTDQGIITCYDSDWIMIKNCSLTNNKRGVLCVNSTAALEENLIGCNEIGIDILNSPNIIIMNNHAVLNNTYGLKTVSSVVCVSDNIFNSNDYGVSLEQSTISRKFIGNKIYNCSQAGIRCYYCPDPKDIIIERCIINHTQRYKENYGMQIYFSNVTIRDTNVSRWPSKLKHSSDVYAHVGIDCQSSNINIEDAKIDGWGTGIFLNLSQKSNIKGSLITDNDNGMRVVFSNATIDNNKIVNNDDGIYYEYNFLSAGNQDIISTSITHNLIDNDKAGIVLYNTHNLIDNDKAGIGLYKNEYAPTQHILYNTEIEIISNNITGNRHGIYCYPSSPCIEENNFFDNDYAIVNDQLHFICAKNNSWGSNDGPSGWLFYPGQGDEIAGFFVMFCRLPKFYLDKPNTHAGPDW